MGDPPARRRPRPAVSLLLAFGLACCARHGQADHVPPAPDPASLITEEVATAAEDTLVELPDQPGGPQQTQVTDDELAELIYQAVEARLAGIPRPRYIPATDFVPPKGLLLHSSRPTSGEFPFALALSGYMQLRWFEFARSATE